MSTNTPDVSLAPITSNLDQQGPPIGNHVNLPSASNPSNASNPNSAPVHVASQQSTNVQPQMAISTSVPSPVPVSLPSVSVPQQPQQQQQSQQSHVMNASVNSAVPAPVPMPRSQHQLIPQQTSARIPSQPSHLQHQATSSNATTTTTTTRSINKVPAVNTRRQSHAVSAHSNQNGTVPAVASIITPNLKMKPHGSISHSASNSSKASKKKKATVTMATTQTATPASTQGENTGRWTAEEHRLFLQGLEEHGKGWKKIASLIKSRTVVQIRTHAQKYFQKLAKARQNGEEGDVSMENRERSSLSTSSKRRRSGTKRKAISSVVASAEREGKRRASAAANAAAKSNASSVEATVATVVEELSTETTVNEAQTYIQPNYAVAPALVPFMYHVNPATSTNSDNGTHAPYHHTQQIPRTQVQTNNNHLQANQPNQSERSVPSITSPHGSTISGAELEQSLFRFLTPNPNEPMDDESGNGVHASTQVNDIARQVGANPITVPSMSMDKTQTNNFVGGDVSPTGVADINSFPTSWVFQNVQPPSWYTKGADVDELLNEAEALDWLADSGDFNEGYTPPDEDLVQDEGMNEAPSSQLSEPSLLSLSGVDNNNNVKLEETVQEHTQTHNIANPVHQLQPDHESVPKTFSNPDVKGISPTPSALNIPPLPSFFESSGDLKTMKKSNTKPSLNNLSSVSLFASATEAADAVGSGDPFLDAQFDEQAFVTALLDQDSNNNLLNHQ